MLAEIYFGHKQQIFKSKQTSWDPIEAGVDGSLDGAGNAPAW
jgi:hypothetical protein